MRMKPNKTTGADERPTVDDFVAELTRAAYCVALRHGASDGWLGLELGLWRVLNDAVKKWDRQTVASRPEGK